MGRLSLRPGGSVGAESGIMLRGTACEIGFSRVRCRWICGFPGSSCEDGNPRLTQRRAQKEQEKQVLNDPTELSHQQERI